MFISGNTVISITFWKLHDYIAIAHRLVLTNAGYTGIQDLCTQCALHSLGELAAFSCFYLSLGHGLS